MSKRKQMSYNAHRDKKKLQNEYQLATNQINFDSST